MFVLGAYPWKVIGDVYFLRQAVMQRSKTIIAREAVYRVLAFFLGDVGKRFIERRYGHLRFVDLLYQWDNLMLVNSDATLVSRAQAECTSADKIDNMDEKVLYCIPQCCS